MGISRRNRGPTQTDKENAAQCNRESRPWDNEASYGKLPRVHAPVPIRPPPHRSPNAERFVPLLRSANNNNNKQNQTSPRPQNQKTHTVKMSVSPRRKADHLSSSNMFTPIDTEAFLSPTPQISAGLATRRDHFEGNDKPSASALSVSDRMRLFEKIDESVRERPASRLLRKSPFKGALDAFVVGAPDERDFSDSADSSSSSEKEHYPIQTPASQLRTDFGNREVTPLETVPKPVPLVGLPIPRFEKRDTEEQRTAPQPQNTDEKRRSRLSVRLSRIPPVPFSGEANDSSSSDDQLSEPEEAEPGEGDDFSSGTESSADIFDDLEVDNLERTPAASESESGEMALPDIPRDESSPGNSKISLEDPELMPRFSYRHSVRITEPSNPLSMDNGGRSMKSSFRHSTRLANEEKSELNFLPKSSSFLDFDDDSRIIRLDSSRKNAEKNGLQSDPSSSWKDMSFDEPESFDTFATLPGGLKTAKELKASISVQESTSAKRPGTNESEKPLFPNMSFSKKTRRSQQVDDDDDGNLDVPNRFTRRPGVDKALRDLQRASVTAGNEISANLRMMSNAHENLERATTKEDKIARVQGDILLRSRIFRRFNLRYASIVHQGYFGAVLLLFRPDSKAGISPSGTFALKSSKMIALAESTVKKVDCVRKAGPVFMFELKTSQRTYTFACNDEEGRDFWVKNLSKA